VKISKHVVFYDGFGFRAFLRVQEYLALGIFLGFFSDFLKIISKVLTLEYPWALFFVFKSTLVPEAFFSSFLLFFFSLICLLLLLYFFLCMYLLLSTRKKTSGAKCRKTDFSPTGYSW